MDLPKAEIYIHPALNSAGFRPRGLKRLEMLLAARTPIDMALFAPSPVRCTMLL
jgi:hypothetical protein